MVIGPAPSLAQPPSSREGASFGEEHLGPSPPKIARSQAASSPPLKRKVPVSSSSRTTPVATIRDRLGANIDPPSPPVSTPEVPLSDRREVTFSDPVASTPLAEVDEDVDEEVSVGISSLSQLYHPQVRLGLIAQTLNLPSPQKESSGFTSSLVDDIKAPRLSLPHAQVIENVATALDKSMTDAPAFNVSVNIGKPKLPDVPMDPLPFPERAHELDPNINLLGKDVADLKRYLVHDDSLVQLDSSARKALRHVSLLEQTIRTVNVLAEGTEPLDHVSIRSLGETLMFSVAAVANAFGWLLGSVCHIRRHGILSKRNRAWSDAECTRLIRLPWSSRFLFGEALSDIARERAQDQANVWSMSQVLRQVSPPRSYASPRFRVDKRWEKYINVGKSRSFRSPGRRPGGNSRGGRGYQHRSPKATAPSRDSRGGKKGGKQ